jgi:predicted RNA binding protein YcfA (HicA-like mRNA interferase family)
MTNDGLPVVSGKLAVRALENAGFYIERTIGSHYVLVHRSDASRAVTVPVHGNRDLKKGTLRAIIRQAGMTVDEFIDLL